MNVSIAKESLPLANGLQIKTDINDKAIDRDEALR